MKKKQIAILQKKAKENAGEIEGLQWELKYLDRYYQSLKDKADLDSTPSADEIETEKVR